MGCESFLKKYFFRVFALKRSQVSTEYLATIAIALMILAAIIAVAFFYTGVLQEQILEKQINSVGNVIIDSANRIFYMNDGSKTSINVYFPNRINRVYFFNNSVVFDFQDYYGDNATIDVPSGITINGILSSYQGYHKISLVLTNSGVWVQEG